MKPMHPEQERAVARILENTGVIVAGAFLVGVFVGRPSTLLDFVGMAGSSLACWWQALVIYRRLAERKE